MIAHRGEFKNPKKSPYNFEVYDSSWEKEFMEELEKDEEIKKWTKNHSIIIDYYDTNSKFRGFKPDFLVEKKDGSIELIEIKGRHLLLEFKKKMESAEKWCNARKMNLRVISRY
ncbi:MAG TPA: hypothetical protein ENH46_05635 [Candidatus Pacearchaeota archaeon]|nr:hypothetical protein [Candidatus Pacearchaeota archaeon]